MADDWLVREKHLDSNQQILLYFFQGGPEMLERWVCAFPNTYFSSSGVVQFANEKQPHRIRTIPANRMLLDTDTCSHEDHPTPVLCNPSTPTQFWVQHNETIIWAILHGIHRSLCTRAQYKRKNVHARKGME